MNTELKSSVSYSAPKPFVSKKEHEYELITNVRQLRAVQKGRYHKPKPLPIMAHICQLCHQPRERKYHLPNSADSSSLSQDYDQSIRIVVKIVQQKDSDRVCRKLQKVKLPSTAHFWTQMSWWPLMIIKAANNDMYGKTKGILALTSFNIFSYIILLKKVSNNY